MDSQEQEKPGKAERRAAPVGGGAPPEAGSPPPPPQAGERPSSLQARLLEKEAEARGLYDQLLRLKAEFENYRKRVDREKPELIRHGKVSLLERLLPLYDVLLAAHGQIAAAADRKGGQAAAAGELIRGLELIFKEFTKLFESEGVQVIESVGKPFDVERHEVLGQVEATGQPDGTIVEELQRGYIVDGRVLRHAKVRIAKSPAPPGGAGGGRYEGD